MTTADYKRAYQQGYSDAMRAKTEWIPVSRMLPEKNMACLVAVGKALSDKKKFNESGFWYKKG